MSTEHLIPDEILAKYHVKEWRNAAGVLFTACTEEWLEIIAILEAASSSRSG